MEEFDYKFPERFTGRILIEQNSKFQNIEAEFVCGFVLTILARANDWQKQFSPKEIINLIVTDKMAAFLLQQPEAFPTSIKKLIDLGEIKIAKIENKGKEILFTATPILCETMKRYGMYKDN